MAVGDKAALLIEIFDGLIGAVHRGRQAELPKAGHRPLRPKRAVDEIVVLLDPFLDYFTNDVALAREYPAVLVRGEHQSVVFTDLADALTGEVTTVLARTGMGEAAAHQGAHTICYVYLGVLMATAGNAVDPAQAQKRFRAAVRFALTEGDRP